MTIPSFSSMFSSMFYPTLLFLNDDQIHNIDDLEEFCAEYFNVSKEDQQERIPSGLKKFRNGIQWGISYLKKGKLIEQSARGKYKITSIGKNRIAHGEVYFNEHSLILMH